MPPKRARAVSVETPAGAAASIPPRNNTAASDAAASTDGTAAVVGPYWLAKTEPDEFSYEMLVKKGREPWTGMA
jgi:hypothetical protein